MWYMWASEMADSCGKKRRSTARGYIWWLLVWLESSRVPLLRRSETMDKTQARVVGKHSPADTYRSNWQHPRVVPLPHLSSPLCTSTQGWPRGPPTRTLCGHPPPTRRVRTTTRARSFPSGPTRALLQRVSCCCLCASCCCSLLLALAPGAAYCRSASFKRSFVVVGVRFVSVRSARVRFVSVRSAPVE